MCITCNRNKQSRGKHLETRALALSSFVGGEGRNRAETDGHGRTRTHTERELGG
jgi:hypothetical protein